MQMKLKWVVRDVDRHGNVRYYFRRDRTKPRIRLRAIIGTPEFLDEYNRALKGQAERGNSAKMVSKDSFEWLVQQYYESLAFTKLDPGTQRTRRGTLKPILKAYGHAPYARMGIEHVEALMAEKAATPEAANNRLKVLKQVFKLAAQRRLVRNDPTQYVEKLKTGSDGWHSWQDDEVRQFEDRHPVGTKARLALALLLYTAQRRSDVVRLGSGNIRAGRITIRQHKNRNRKPITVSFPVPAELQRILATSPTGDLTFLATEYGKPFSAAGFGNWFRDRCNEAGLPHCSAHGLRKAAAARLAESGCTAHELMAVTGHLTLSEAQKYVEAANRKKMADTAMGKLDKANW